MSPEEFNEKRQIVETEFGHISYVEMGKGPVAVFLHGFPLNGYHWRGQMSQLQSHRRCVAIDLMGLGYSDVPEEQDLGFPAQAKMILSVLDKIGINTFDLIGNDSGGAIAQIIAVQATERVRTLTLTNCDVHDNWPPATFSQTVQLANAGRLGSAMTDLVDNLGLARSDFGLGVGFEDTRNITRERVLAYADKIPGNPKRQAQIDKFVSTMNCEQTTELYESLKALDIPTLIIWGTGDVFFPVKWAHWLKETMGSAVDCIEIEGARLFFCEERADEVNNYLLEFWENTENMVYI